MRLRETSREKVSLMTQPYIKDHIKGIAVLDNLKRAIIKLRKRSRGQEARKLFGLEVGKS